MGAPYLAKSIRKHKCIPMKRRFAAFADYATQPISQAELELLTTQQAVACLCLSCTECVMDGFERHAASTLKILMRRAIQAQVILAARLEFHR